MGSLIEFPKMGYFVQGVGVSTGVVQQERVPAVDAGELQGVVPQWQQDASIPVRVALQQVVHTSATSDVPQPPGQQDIQYDLVSVPWASPIVKSPIKESASVLLHPEGSLCIVWGRNNHHQT